MSAIKKFFNHAREVEQRQIEWENKRIAKLEKIKEEEEKPKTYEEEFIECDNLLRRDWFLDEQSILELIQELPDSAFYKIIDNAHIYSKTIQEILYRFKVPSYIDKLKLQVREIDDDEMYELDMQREAKQKEQFDNVWKIFKAEMGLTRPEGDVDTKYNELFEKVKEVTKKLEEEKVKPTPKKAYVAPHLRGKETQVVNVEIEKIQNELRNLENEIKKVKIEIDNEEQKWEDERKQYHYTEIWNKMCQV
jgi:hypothetical protein